MGILTQIGDLVMDQGVRRPESVLPRPRLAAWPSTSGEYMAYVVLGSIVVEHHEGGAMLRGLMDRLLGRDGRAEADVDPDPARVDARGGDGASVGRIAKDEDWSGETGAERREQWETKHRRATGASSSPRWGRRS